MRQGRHAQAVPTDSVVLELMDPLASATASRNKKRQDRSAAGGSCCACLQQPLLGNMAVMLLWRSLWWWHMQWWRYGDDHHTWSSSRQRPSLSAAAPLALFWAGLNVKPTRTSPYAEWLPPSRGDKTRNVPPRTRRAAKTLPRGRSGTVHATAGPPCWIDPSAGKVTSCSPTTSSDWWATRSSSSQRPSWILRAIAHSRYAAGAWK